VVPLSTMELSSFRLTKFGDWVVKLSYSRADATFLVFAFGVNKDDFIFRMFYNEMDVINFVSFLGEKYE
jgi:hypothetical protein